MKEKRDTRQYLGRGAGRFKGKSRVRNLTYVHATEEATRVEDPGTGMLLSTEGTGRCRHRTRGAEGVCTQDGDGGWGHTAWGEVDGVRKPQGSLLAQYI